MGTEFNRRTFLKGSVVAAVASGALLAGCAPQQQTAASEQQTTAAESGKPSYLTREPVGEPEETVSADFIVCGAGGCGLSAALQAQELGLNVILLEKKDVAGGTFGFSEVTFAAGSKLLAEQGYDINPHDLVLECLDASHWIPSYSLLETFYNQVGETIEWVQTFGCEFDNSISGKALFYKGDKVKGAGFTFIDNFVRTAEERGIEIRYQTAAKELVVEDGKVTGVLAVDDDDKVIKFEAPAVLVSTGGWASNTDMLEQLGKVKPERVTATGYEGRDGDGIIMGQNAGAALARGEGTIMLYGPLLPGSNWGEPLYAAASQPTLWVNESGERFMDEGSKNQIFKGLVLRDVKRAFVVCSQAEIDSYTANGIWQTNSGHINVGDPQPNLPKLLQAQLDAENERIFVADTSEELAETAGIDTRTFSETVNAYNGFVEAKADEQFNKDPEFLTPLTTGPFYAFEVNDGYYTTVGGLKVNRNAQVINEDGEIIEGLYAGGCDAGGLCGDAYDFGTAPGTQSSWAMNSGRLAAKHIASLASA